MFLAFFRGQGGVETPHHHRDAPAAKTRGQLKGPGGLVGHEGEAHQVAVFPEGDLLQHVVLDLHLNVAGVSRRPHTAGSCQEASAFAAVQAAFLTTSGKLESTGFS